jgi:hypothetical protein
MHNWTKYLPTQQAEQDELDNAAANHARTYCAAEAAEVDAGPDQHTDYPDHPKQ